MVGGKADKPWTWREQICICPTFNFNLAKQAHMALLCCYTTETSCTLPLCSYSLTFRKPSLPNGWKGDEQMQEVSLESPCLVGFAHIGDKLVKNVADLLPSLSLDVDC